MSILVTGHTGFLGQHIVRRLSASGVTWRGLDRRPSGQEREIIGDVRHICNTKIDATTITAIIHLASPVGVRTTSWRDDVTYEEIVAGATAVASLAQRANARVVFMSSSEIYGNCGTVISDLTKPNPLSGYARGKLEAEKILCGSLPETVVIRPFNVYGPVQRPEFVIPMIIDCVLCNRPVPLVNEGRSIRQFTYVGDLVEAVTRVREGWTQLSKRALNIAGPEAIETRELALAVGRILRREVRFVSVTPERIGRNPATEITSRRVKSDSIDGWQPLTALAEGLHLTIEARAAH